MLRISKTLDGSDTLTDQNRNETYHSMNGAIQESMHVFIKNGLHSFRNSGNSISIFEMGFGTGLNVLLTLIHRPEKIKISYKSIEAFPVDPEILNRLNYDSISNDPNLYKSIISLPFNEPKELISGFHLHKQKENFVSGNFTEENSDIIYFDAFGPKIQPELWTTDSMRKCFTMLNTGGILVTYCAQGQFKRNLRDAGFTVEKLQGPPGKREMTRAIKL